MKNRLKDPYASNYIDCIDNCIAGIEQYSFLNDKTIYNPQKQENE